MSLDEQVAQFTNPQDFTRLCTHVFTAAFPNDYQVIDGTQGDSGNDGYIRSEQRILAFHCPVKPEQKTAKGYQEKALSDMEKACRIRDSGQLPVLAWSFITPRKLPHHVIVFLESEAKNRGLSMSHLESTFLAGVLLQNRQLLREFSWLHVSELEELLRQAIPLEEEVRKHAAALPKEGEAERRIKVVDMDGYRKVAELRHQPASADTKTQLRAIYYKATDPVVQVNALLGVLETFDPVVDNVPELIGLCSLGSALAKHLGDLAVEAFLHAKRGNLISWNHSSLDLEEWAHHQADQAIGMNLDPGRRPKNLARLQELKKQYSESFTKALEIAKGDPQTYASVLVELGNAAGLRATYLQKIGGAEAVGAEMAVCKDALMRAKNLYAFVGDELGAANAVFNLANQIRFQGEIAEAKELTAMALERARSLGYADLLQKATWLMETLETGQIPDYVGGERREPMPPQRRLPTSDQTEP